MSGWFRRRTAKRGGLGFRCGRVRDVGFLGYRGVEFWGVGFRGVGFRVQGALGVVYRLYKGICRG